MSSQVAHLPNFVPVNHCCLIDGQRCHNTAGSAHYSKRVEKVVREADLKLFVDRNALHLYICDEHKHVLKKARDLLKQSKRREIHVTKKNTHDDRSARHRDHHGHSCRKKQHELLRQHHCSLREATSTDLDLSMLPLQALYRYKRTMGVVTTTGLPKQQLAKTISDHLKTIQVNEKEVLSYFIYMSKTGCNKLDREREDRNAVAKATFQRPKMNLIPTTTTSPRTETQGKDDEKDLRSYCRANSPQL